MIHQLNLQGKDKVEIAIERIKMFEPEDGYWLAFSGGKDSCLIKALADMAGVKYEAHYSVTGIDPPELVRFIKAQHPDVIWDVPRDRGGCRITMWSLIPKKKMPPTRIVRYCCEALKESHGLGRLTMPGVRWAESANRKNTQGGITLYDKTALKLIEEEMDEYDYRITSKGGVVLRLDNDESKRMVEMCYKTHKTVFNPVIDWTDDEVWEFLKEYHIPYCELYDQGARRLGCIGCPMSTQQQQELERYPKYKNLYMQAFAKMIDARKDAGLEVAWQTPQEVMDWWTKK